MMGTNRLPDVNEVSDNGSTKQFADATLTLRIDDNWTSQSNAALYSFTTNYDPAGNISNFTDSVTGQWSNIQYDSLGRLSLASQLPISGPTNYWCWDYDLFGNRQHQQSVTGAGYSNSPGSACQLPSGGTLVSNQWASYTIDGTSGTNDNGLNRLTASSMGSYTYDSAGNVTADPLNSYLYDGDGRICAMKQPGQGGTTMMQYIYDADGNRVAKGTISNFNCDTTSNGFHPVTVYVLGAGGGQLSELSNASTSQTPSWQFAHTNVYAASQQIATYDADLSGQTEGNLYFHLSDWLGTRRQQTDYAGNPVLNFTSLPFGDGYSPISVSNTNAADASEHHFTGKERDTESGNDYFGARYYASSMGRWMNPDWSPSPDAVPYADLENPQTLNLYSYAGNNPLIHIDADGHCWPQWLCQKVLGALIKVVSLPVSAYIRHQIRVTAEHRQYLIDHGVTYVDKSGNLITPDKLTPAQVNDAFKLLIAGAMPMLGARGAQITSKTLWQDGEKHIDVENPNPGQRPGQIHYQDGAGGKYIYNPGTGQFEGLSKTQSDVLMSKPGVQEAIQKGLRFLGVQP